MDTPKYFGTNYTPPDLVAKFTGKARYAEDFRADGMLFVKLLLSPMPHARAKNIDVSEALAMKGVHAVLLPDEVPGADNPLTESALTAEPLYEGQPIVAVAAVDELTAANAVEKIKIDFEPLPFALDPLESLKPNGPNALTGGNIMNREGREWKVGELKWTKEDFESAGKDKFPMGEHQTEWYLGEGEPEERQKALDAAFEQSAAIIDESIYHQSVTHHPMEPRTCMAYWENGKLFIHPSTQSVAFTVGSIAAQAQIDPEDLVLICEYTGGGFGSKIAGSINMIIPVLLAKKTKRPVMHRVTRYEETYYGRARPGFQGHARMGFTKEGRLNALDLYIVQDNGPYGSQGDVRTAGNIASLSYQPMNMRYRGVSVLTNTPPRSAQRAPGGAQITAMLEPLLDQAAKKLGIDRLEMRRINAPGPDATFGPTATRLTSIRALEAIDKMKALVNWDQVKQLSGKREGSKVTGVGVALSSFMAGASGKDGLMILRPDGKLQIQSGVGNLGTHSYADTARVACDVLDFPWEKVEMVWGNTGKGLPNTTMQAGSMTTFATTKANHAAAMDAKQKLMEIAARDLGGAPEDYQVGGERVFSKEDVAKGLTFAEAAQRAIELGGKFSGEEVAEELHNMTKASAAKLAGQGLMGVAKDTYDNDGRSTYSFVVGYARVELDVETGHVDIVDYAATTDCGLVMNPRSLAAQLLGGGIQGMGMASGQKWIYDPKWGVPFAHRFYTARPPGILDVPLEMKTDFVNLPDPYSPVGAKGIGEPPVGAGEAALVCAIQDAMGGTAFNRTPIMTDMIIDALEQNERPHGALAAHV